MARLQDFPTVTPTSSDNLLIVQSQGQGLVSYGNSIGSKMDKTNPTGTGMLTMTGSGVFSGGLQINGSDDVVSTVYSHYNWANTHTFKVSKPATYLLFTDSGNDMAKLKVFADNVATLYQMIGTTIQSVSLNTSTMEVTVTVNNKGLCAIRLM